MIVCYIAGKYTDTAAYKIKQNIYIADLLGMEIIKRFGHRGVMVIIPHTNTAHWEGIQSDEWFYEATEELLKRSDVCIYVPGDRKRSTGTRQEIEYCINEFKPYFAGDEIGLEDFSQWLTKNQK